MQSDKSSEHVILELLKVKLEHQQKLQADFFKGASIFLLIVGALLTFALDADSSSALRYSLLIVGVVIPTVGMIVVNDGRRAISKSEEEIDHLNTLLCKPLKNTRGFALHYCIKAIFMLCVTSILGFGILLGMVALGLL